MRSRDFSTMRRPSGSGLALTAAGLLALIVATQQALEARSELRQADARVTEASRTLGALRQDVKRIEARPGTIQAALARALAAESAPPSEVLRDLVALLPGGVRLDGLTIAYGKDVEIEAAIVAREAADYDVFLEHISASSRFGSVAPGAETREGEVHTTLHLLYRDGSDQ
jgi:Tfp pilus assembly protein PilN